MLAFGLCAQTPFVSTVWKADNGDGTYRNPIIHADYSDPDVVRVGDDYYMTASSFNAVPGLPILHIGDPMPNPAGLLDDVPALREPFTADQLLEKVRELVAHQWGPREA